MEFLNQEIKLMKAYRPGEQPQSKNQKIIKLNTNENTCSPHPIIINFLKNIDFESLNKYPDPSNQELKLSLIEYFLRYESMKLRNQNIIFGNGADELLSLIFRGLLDQNDVVLLTEFTYSYYYTQAQAKGLKVKKLNMPKWTIDIENINHIIKNSSKKIKACFITNPNSPTGISLSKEEIEYCVNKNPNVLFVIDEAYINFSQYESCALLILNYDNIIVVRSLSKGFALANLRIGYAISSIKIAKGLSKLKDPYNINGISQTVAKIALDNAHYYHDFCTSINSTKVEFKKQLLKLDFEVLPSETNFLFCKPLWKVKNKKINLSRYLYGQLKKNNIYVRYFDSPVIDEYLRITIGLKKEMSELENVITHIKSSLF